MRRWIVVALLSLALAGCDTVVLPAWYAPTQYHNLDCRNGECSMGERGSSGEL